MKNPHLAVHCALCLFCAFSAQGQQLDTLRKVIPEIMVTATRIPEDPEKVSRSVTVINDGTVQQLQANDLGQLLSMQQGMSVTGAGQNPGLTQTLFTRGTNSNHTLVMVDGVRITDPSTVNDALDLVEIPFSGFDQLEIVRGSHSTLYGPSCIGGAINLLTGGRQSPGFHGRADFRGGAFGASTLLLEQNIQLNYSWKSGLYANVNFYNTTINGLDATVDTVTNPAAFKNYDRDDLHLLKGSAKLGFENTKWNAFVTYGITDQHTDYDKSGWKYNNPYGPNPLAWYDGDSTKIKALRNLITYNVQHSFSSKFSMALSGGYTSLNRVAVDDSSVIDHMGNNDHTYSDADYFGSNMNHDLQATWRLRGVNLIGGAGLLNETMTFQTSFYTNTGYGVYEAYTNLDSLNLHSFIYDAYAQAELSGRLISENLDWLNLIAGLRYNDHDKFGTAVNYEINPSIRVMKDGIIYFSLSSGFNAPSLYQLYSPETYYTSSITRGNPFLQPEASHSLELGYKQKLSDQFRFEAAVYQNTVRDEIEYVYLWNGAIPVDSLGSDFLRDDFRGDTYLNVGTLQSRGIELFFSSSISKKFGIRANLNLVEGKLTYDPDKIDTSHTGSNHIQLYSNGAFPTQEIETTGLTRRPSTANLFISYQPLEPVNLNVVARFIGNHSDIFYDSDLGPYGALNTVELNSYLLFDLMASWQINQHVALRVKAENFLNTHYVDLSGFTSKGRGFYFTVSANL
jgi:vitamin B12 transporter